MIANGHVRGELEVSYRAHRAERDGRSPGGVSRAERDGMKRETSDYEFLHRLELRTGERGRR
jgi:hypothetical protein